MRITFIAGYFTPEQSADTHLNDDLARDLAIYGAEVEVVVPFPSRGLSQDDQEEYVEKKREVVGERLRVNRIGKAGIYHSGLMRRGVNLIVKSIRLYFSARRIKTDCYLVTSTPPFLGYIAILLSKKAPVVYKLQDIFPDSLIKTKGWSEKNILVKLLRCLEKRVYEKVAQIVVMSNDMKMTLQERGVQENKIQVIYDWIDVTACYSIKKEENLLVKQIADKKDKFIVSYAGNIGHLQNLRTVLSAAELIQKESLDIVFVIIGDGAWKSTMLDIIKERELKNIVVMPLQPLEYVSEVYSLPDVGLVSLKQGVSKAALPSKTWSILSASRPVICEIDLDSELASIIKTVNCGVSVASGDATALANAILQLYNLDEEELKMMGTRGRAFVVNNLSRETSTQKYYQLVKRVAQGDEDNVKR